jgi:hypothetical protein
MISQGAGPGRVDFLISYAGSDRAWAQWVASVLEAAGYSTELDVWDWMPGDNVVLRMSNALQRAGRVLALWSPEYFESGRFTVDEWTPLMAERPDSEGRRRLVPVRVAPVTPPKVLEPLGYRNLFALPEAAARKELLAAVAGPSGRGQAHPFPGGKDTSDGGQGPRVPGSLPPVWNVPARNPGFTGRRTVLASLRERLTGQQRAWVQALNGIGGVGKTQVAIEYAHLFAGEYDLVWWIDAERAELIGEHVAALAVAAGWVPDATKVTDAVKATTDRLAHLNRWLLVFDNVEDPAHLPAWLPADDGQVIVTSRRRGWAPAATVEVGVFTREESLDLLSAHLPQITPEDAGRVATKVGDLPLGIAQAAGLLAETRMPVGEYLQELAEHCSETLEEGTPQTYPRPLAAAIRMSLDQLEHLDPAAAAVLHTAAVLAPDPIPSDWFRTTPPETQPQALRPVTGRHLTWRKTLTRINDLGLAVVSEHTLQVHRLTQAILRDHRTPTQATADRDHAIALITAAAPTGEGRDPASWPVWATILPHLLALDPATAPPALHQLALRAHWYLYARGEPKTALPLARTWHQHWSHTLGPDHPDTLASAYGLAVDLSALGRHQEAHDLFQTSLDDHDLDWGL